MNQIPSLLVSIPALLGYIIIGQKKRVGWLVSIVAEVAWFAYGVAYDQIPFAVLSVIFAIVFIREYRKWGTDD